MRKIATAFVLCTVILAVTPSAFADFTEVDLSSVVNLGFQNSWFINGAEFTPILGNTTGNQGTGIPFLVANTPDSSGQGGDNNFWFGLFGGPGNQLVGSPLSVTIPVNVAGATTVYTLADNTFGTAGNNEFSVTFNPLSGSPITENYIGANNTKDYNLNCATTGCDATPNAQYWFIDADGTQWLQVVAWTLPAGFGTLSSVTINQVDTFDGAIFAGLTVASPATSVPEPASIVMLGVALASLGFLRRRASR
jgi:hypothetical protein